MIFREMQPEDEESCHRLFELGKTDHPKAYENMTTDNLQNTMVAEDSGTICGMISAYPVQDRTVLGFLVVDREHRGRKVAPGLIKAATEKFGRSMSMVAPHARESFEQAGFKMTGYLMENA